jgi:rubredoxin
MTVQTAERKPKPWACPSCEAEIGKVLFGQLYLSGDVTANTDGANIVIKCPACGARKIWFANDRMSIILSEIADQVVKKLASNQARSQV